MYLCNLDPNKIESWASPVDLGQARPVSAMKKHEEAKVYPDNKHMLRSVHTVTRGRIISETNTL